MIVRCAKCQDLLGYTNKGSKSLVSRCHNGCNAGFQTITDETERIEECWYISYALTLQKTREKQAEPEVVPRWFEEEDQDESDIIRCWYKHTPQDEWKTGFFLIWSQDHVEFESGPGNFPVAVVEDAVSSRVHVVHASLISFNLDDPEGEDND